MRNRGFLRCIFSAARPVLRGQIYLLFPLLLYVHGVHDRARDDDRSRMLHGRGDDAHGHARGHVHSIMLHGHDDAHVLRGRVRNCILRVYHVYVP